MSFTLPGATWPRFIRSIKDSEGFSDTPYQDSEGNWTVGWGHKLREGKPRKGKYASAELSRLLRKDLNRAEGEAQELLEGITYLLPGQITVVIEMCFILGKHGASEFKLFFGALREGSLMRACWQLRHDSHGNESPWYKEEPNRVNKLCERLMTGKLI